MPFTLIQSGGASGSNTKAFGSSVTAGHVVVVWVAYQYSGSAISSPGVTDSAGNTYILAVSQTDTVSFVHYTVAIYYSQVTTGGALTVTYQPAGTGVASLAVAEYSFTGTLSADGSSSGTGTGTSLASGGFTTAGASDLVLGIGIASATGQTWTAGGGATAVFSGAGSSGVSSICATDQLGVSPGTASVAITDTASSAWVCVSAAFSCSPGSPVMAASCGVFSLTGKSASFLHDRAVTASSGGFSLTGASAGLAWNVATTTASAGIFNLTGESAALLHGRHVPASAGVFALAGQPAVLIAGLGETASAGAFSLTGAAAGLYHGSETVASAGAFDLTGESAGLLSSTSQLLIASAGVFTLSRIPASLTWQHLVVAGAGVFGLTGPPALLEQPYELPSSAGNFALTGANAGLYGQRLVSASCGVFGLTGEPAAIIFTPSGSPGTVGYHVYASPSVNQPVNYNSPVATTDALTWTSGPLAYPGTWKFGVRAFDNYGAESNLTCSVTIVLSAAGTDISNLPGPPSGLRAFATAGGGIRIEWGYAGPFGVKAPSAFHVYATTSGPLSYTTPVATVSYASSMATSWASNLGPYASGTVVTIGVRAFNAAAEEQNTNTVSATSAGTGPSAVASLTATATV